MKLQKLLYLPAVLGFTLFFAASGAYAQGKGKGQKAAEPAATVSASVTIGISVDAAKHLAAAHALTGQRALPPGIARNLARGKPLPPGIAKKAVPPSMLADLPPVDGHEWVIAGEDLILVALGTAIVVSILDEVFE